MDFDPVYQQLFTTFWYLIPLLIIVGLIKSPWFKGKFGEFLVNLSARCFLDKSRYHLIKNVTLPTEDGTTQPAPSSGTASRRVHQPPSKLFLARQDCNSLIAAAIGNQDPRLLRERDKACARYKAMRGEVY